MPWSLQLTAQQKKVAMIASAVFAFMAVCVLVHCFYTRSSRKWIIEGEDLVSIPEEPSPNAKESYIAEQILKRAAFSPPGENQEGIEENKIENSSHKCIEEIRMGAIDFDVEMVDEGFVEEDELEDLPAER